MTTTKGDEMKTMTTARAMGAWARVAGMARVVGAMGAMGAGIAMAATQAERENEYWRLLTVPIPEGIVLEAGAVQVFGKDRLAVSTRLGEIWFVDGAYGDPPTPATVKFTRYAQGLHEVLGLTTRGDGWFYATQRGEITRMKDTNGDDRADVFETYADGWGITGDYHEYAFGSKA